LVSTSVVVFCVPLYNVILLVVVLCLAFIATDCDCDVALVLSVSSLSLRCQLFAWISSACLS